MKDPTAPHATLRAPRVPAAGPLQHLTPGRTELP
jgi:hypothetical protein